MSILFDDASLEYAEAASAVSAAFPLALGCMFYIDDLDIDQTLISLANSASEDTYFALSFLSQLKEITDVTTLPNGIAEITDVTTVADVSKSLENTYFTIDSPTTSYYVWFSIDSSSIDPAPGGTGIEVVIVENDTADDVAFALQTTIDSEPDFGASVLSNVVTITNAALGLVTDAVDVDTTFTVLVTTQGANNTLDGTYFHLDSPTTPYYVWFSIDSSSIDPAPGGRTGIEVDITIASSAGVIAIALQTAIDSETDFSASVLSDVVTITNAAVGPVTDAVDVDTIFGIVVTTQGRNATIEARISDNTSTLDIAISSGTVTLNTWHHALALFDIADIQIYLDGANNGSFSGSAVFPTGLNRTAVARLSKLTPIEYVSGRVAEITIWDLSTFLTAAEIGDIGTDKLDHILMRSDELAFHAPAQQAIDPLIDIIAHLNLTLVNTPTTANHPPIQNFDPETFARFRSGPVQFNKDVQTPLTLQPVANIELIKPASNSFGFNQVAVHNVIVISVETNFGLSDSVARNIEKTIAVVQSLGLGQATGPVTEESASSSLGFSQVAARAGDPSNDLELTQAVTAEKSKGIENDLGLTQQVSPQLDLTIAVASDLGFIQNVVPYVDIPCNRHEYDPQGGSLPAVAFGVGSDVTLVCGAASITLRNPTFGNSEVSDVARALNISRGGTPNIVRDPQWSKVTLINISFEVLQRTKAIELLDFLQSCLGLLVTYTDPDARDWEGIILNPEEAVIDEGDCKYSANIRLEASPV